MATDFHSRAIKLAKYEDLRPAAYGVLGSAQLGKKIDKLKNIHP